MFVINRISDWNNVFTYFYNLPITLKEWTLEWMIETRDKELEAEAEKRDLSFEEKWKQNANRTEFDQDIDVEYFFISGFDFDNEQEALRAMELGELNFPASKLESKYEERLRRYNRLRSFDIHGKKAGRKGHTRRKKAIAGNTKVFRIQCAKKQPLVLFSEAC